MKKINKRRTRKTLIGIFCSVFFSTILCSTNIWANSSLPPTKYSIDVDFTVTGSSIGFLFGATTSDNLYMWQLNTEMSNHFRLRPHIRKSGSWSTSSDVDISNIITEATKNAQHHMRIDVNEDTIRTAINGILVDTRIDSTYLHGKYGRVGIRVYHGPEDGLLDNLVIKDGDDNILYSNDFEVSALDFPNCDIVDGKLKNNFTSEFILKNEMWTTKYSIETDLTVRNGAVSFLFSALDNDNLLMWQFNTDQANARFRPQKKLNGGWSDIKEVDLSAIIPDNKKNAEHHMKIDVQGTSIVTYFDGEKADSLVLEELGYGNFGFRYSSEDGSFDNLVIKDSTGKILYANDFNRNPLYNFPNCISVDGKLTNGNATPEFNLYTQSTKLLTNELLVPKTQVGLVSDTISVKLFSYADYTIRNLAIHYRVNGGAVSDGTLSSIPAFSSINYTFPQKYTFSKHFPEVDTIMIWTTYDTITSYVENYLPGTNWALNYTGNRGKQVQVGSSPSLNPDKFTVEAWVYPTAFRESLFEGSIVSNENDPYLGYALQVGGPDGKVGFEIGNAKDWEGASGGSLVLNQWQHIAGVFTGDSIKVYLNGLLKDAKKISSQLTKSTNPLLIGSSPAFAGYEFNGKIDEVSIWNTALTDTQINLNFKTDIVGKELGLIAYYKFDEGPSSLTVGDFSGNGHTGTLISFTDQDSIWVFGKALPDILLEVPASLNIAATEGSVVTMTIHSNASWNISNLPVWLTASPENGAGGTKLVTLTANVNPNATTRSAKIAISNGFMVDSILVTQAASAIVSIDVNTVPSFSVYPNPTSGAFNIKMNTSQEVVDVTICNILGEVVKTIKLQNSTAINISDMANGLYVVKVTSGNITRTQKVIKR